MCWSLWTGAMCEFAYPQGEHGEVGPNKNHVSDFMGDRKRYPNGAPTRSAQTITHTNSQNKHMQSALHVRSFS
jgi:hypothetical protein